MSYGWINIPVKFPWKLTIADKDIFSYVDGKYELLYYHTRGKGYNCFSESTNPSFFLLLIDRSTFWSKMNLAITLCWGQKRVRRQIKKNIG